MADNRTSRVTVAMLGARRHYAVPRLLHEVGLLEHFIPTAISAKPWMKAALELIPATVRPHVIQRWLGRRDEVLPPG